MSNPPRSQDGTDTEQIKLFDDRWPWPGRPLVGERSNTLQDDEQQQENWVQSRLDNFY